MGTSETRQTLIDLNEHLLLRISSIALSDTKRFFLILDLLGSNNGLSHIIWSALSPAGHLGLNRA